MTAHADEGVALPEARAASSACWRMLAATASTSPCQHFLKKKLIFRNLVGEVLVSSAPLDDISSVSLVNAQSRQLSHRTLDTPDSVFRIETNIET